MVPWGRGQDHGLCPAPGSLPSVLHGDSCCVGSGATPLGAPKIESLDTGPQRAPGSGPHSKCLRLCCLWVLCSLFSAAPSVKRAPPGSGGGPAWSSGVFPGSVPVLPPHTEEQSTLAPLTFAPRSPLCCSRCSGFSCASSEKSSWCPTPDPLTLPRECCLLRGWPFALSDRSQERESQHSGVWEA